MLGRWECGKDGDSQRKVLEEAVDRIFPDKAVIFQVTDKAAQKVTLYPASDRRTRFRLICDMHRLANMGAYVRYSFPQDRGKDTVGERRGGSDAPLVPQPPLTVFFSQRSSHTLPLHSFGHGEMVSTGGLVFFARCSLKSTLTKKFLPKKSSSNFLSSQKLLMRHGTFVMLWDSRFVRRESRRATPRRAATAAGAKLKRQQRGSCLRAL